MSAEGWEVIIGAIFLGVCHVVNLILGYKREVRKEQVDREMAAQLREVKTATNGLVHEVVETAKAAIKVGNGKPPPT